MRDIGILARLTQQSLARVLVVVAGLEHAAEVFETMHDKPHAGIICRNWIGDPAARWSTVGQDLDLLAVATLRRLVQPEAVPTELAVMVPPKWYQGTV